MRAAAFALNILVIHALGDVSSPVIIGLLNDWLGDLNKSFLVVGLMFLAAGVFWLLGARFLQRDTERAPRIFSGLPSAAPAATCSETQPGQDPPGL
jgi:hypothetical protein